jgi:hypothetical protein
MRSPFHSFLLCIAPSINNNQFSEKSTTKRASERVRASEREKGIKVRAEGY